MTGLVEAEEIARGLSEAQRVYIAAVAASDGPYAPRHGRTANWALQHKITESVVRMPDGRQGAWEDFTLAERMDPGISAILGQRLTPLGKAVRASLTNPATSGGGNG